MDKQRQMCWRIPGTNQQEPLLHLRNSSDEPWTPYYMFPGSVPDGDPKHASPGFRTFQAFLKQGYEVIDSTLPTQQSSTDLEQQIIKAQSPEELGHLKRMVGAADLGLIETKRLSDLITDRLTAMGAVVGQLMEDEAVDREDERNCGDDFCPIRK